MVRNGRNQLRNVFKHKDREECKNIGILLKLTPTTRRRLKEIWRNRQYPHPFDKNKRIPFNSESEYLEFIIKALNNAGSTSWRIFSSMLDPDFPQD